MYLLLDLSAKDAIHLALFDEQKIIHTEIAEVNRELLALVEAFFTEQDFKKESLKGILTVVGTGGFTSTRIASVVANTFGYVLHIPLLAMTADQVNQVQLLIPELLKQPIGQYISPTYSGAPNITHPK